MTRRILVMIALTCLILFVGGLAIELGENEEAAILYLCIPFFWVTYVGPAVLRHLSTTKKPEVQQDFTTIESPANAKWPTDQRFIDALSSHIDAKPRPPRGQYDYTDIEITRLIGFVENLPDGFPSSHGLELFCREDTVFDHIYAALHDFNLADVFALYADAIELHDIDRIN